MGVPTLGCHCEVCTSLDPHDNRLRPSILIGYNGRNILIDTTPDFRTQALRARIDHLDAILFTHEHADHIMGLDDVRPFSLRQKCPIPIYGSSQTMEAIQRCFRYIFDGREKLSSVPRLTPHILNGEALELFGLEIQPIRLLHGMDAIFGFRFGGAAYLTDHSDVPDGSKRSLQDLDVLFLDALRFRPHPTHSTVDLSIQTAQELAAQRAFFTHISHDLHHSRTARMLPPNIYLAYDGLELHVEARG